MLTTIGLCAGLLVSFLTLAAPCAAQQLPSAPVESQAGAEEAEGEPLNEVGLVLAGTRAEDETSFTIGAEYVRRLGNRFAVVGEVEHVSGPGSWVFAVPVAFRLTDGLKLFAGPGFERRPVESEPEADEAEVVSAGTARENQFLWRVGTSCSWEFTRRYALTPAVYMDFIRNGDAWVRAFVFGITAGVAF